MTFRIAHAVIAATLLMTTTGAVSAGQRSAADQALYEKAVKACSGPRWPDGARPYINYAGGWFRCVEPKRG